MTIKSLSLEGYFWKKKVSLLIAGVVALSVFVAAYALWTSYAVAPILFKDDFSTAKDGLLTSEFSYWSPSSAAAKHSANWEMTSGALFAQGQQAYSGVPTYVTGNAVADPTTTAKNNSAVFRLTTKRADFGNVKVDFKLNVKQQVSTTGTPAVAWDGIHVFMRYQSQYNLYYASVNRRDGAVVIKKKCAGGPSNDGTYYTLGGEVKNHPIPFNTWQNVAVAVQNNADGTVTISLYREGNLLHKATDKGVGCAVISAPGKTGIRGDNTEFLFDDFTVTSLDATTGDAQAPSVSIGSPSTGSTVTGTINLTATATDNVGVTKLEYWLDGALLNATTAEPYTYAFNTTSYANGSHSLVAKAYDAAGNVGSSAAVGFTVKNSVADTQAPTAPTNLQITERTQSSIAFAWTGSSDNVGVSGYTVYRNGIKLKNVTTTSFVDGNLQAATAYNYTVEAYDAAGNTSPRSSSLDSSTLPPDAAGVSATVTVKSDWNSGYCATVIVTNNGKTAVTGWKTSFTTPGKVTSIWNVGSWGQTGNTVTIQNAHWNGNLGAGKSLTDIGFCAQK